MKDPVLSTPHDSFFKAALSNPEVVREFLTTHLPESILKNLDFKSISICSNTFIDEELKLSASDVLLECSISDKKSYIYLLCEHQSTQDELMSFRLLKYLIKIWEYHLSQNKKSKLPFPVIFPLVFYTGKGVYTKPRAVWDLCGDKSELMRDILQQPFHLVDVNLIPEETLMTRAWSGTMEFLMRHRFRQHLSQEIGKIAQNINRLVLEDQEQFVLQLLHYIMAVDEEHRNISELTTIIHEQLSPEVEGKIMNLADRIKEEGRLEGEIQGERKGELKGRLEGKLETAQEMINAGSDFAFIAKVTHLPLEKIKSLKNKH
ncbi:MAG: Rpn family recombination-promoting nuclease/putative transposase [Gammaproteobacteria bacterium]|nr:Rpn family recombination-promoting nuclease/putative transposase [Gammaproteobacteria bacterium]